MNHKTYKIQKGDTLESISKKLDITPFELKNFHNNHCELKDLIGSKIPKHLNFILLPAQENRKINSEKPKAEIKINLKKIPFPLILFMENQLSMKFPVPCKKGIP